MPGHRDCVREGEGTSSAGGINKFNLMNMPPTQATLHECLNSASYKSRSEKKQIWYTYKLL